MFREMCRSHQALPQEECAAILDRGTHGVLALAGDEGYPYARPISYVYADGKLYFHCAKSGHKLDAIGRCPKASFCVVTKADIVPDAYNCLFLSTVAFGRVRPAKDEQEKRRALELMIDKYSKGFEEGGRKYINVSWDEVQAFVIELEHITGKKGTP